ncbi:multicopper oxidase domain-containing protein [Streptosporangium canum]|uniref:multicopper oxidase domain-containing protein n=1 Tax=Streptosporangium canum TaxID=324952 RepID=UPI0036AAEB14
MVALTPGERVVLRSASPATGAGLVQRDGGDDRFDVLELRAARTLTDSPELPDHLAALPPLPAHTAVRTRTFELAEHHINGRKMDPRRIDARVGKDTTEIWEVRSGDGTLHTFHVHDVQFQVLSIDDRKPPPELSGGKDTVLLPPGTRMRLIMRFADYCCVPQWRSRMRGREPEAARAAFPALSVPGQWGSVHPMRNVALGDV